MNSQLVSRPWPASIGLGCLITVLFLNGPAYGAFGEPEKWQDFFCVGGELCAVGDFNGDNRDDVIALVRNSQPGVPQGDVWVALSTGSKFLAVQKWNDWIASNGEEVVIGDFNYDGRDDIAVFIKNTQPEPARGDVWVYLSTGINFSAAQKWHDFMCVGQQVCAAGDFNKDGRDDVIAFVRDTQTLTGRGDVWVALSTGNSFSPRQKWSDFLCIGQEVCATGDFNGDRYDDVIAFVRDTQTGTGRGDVWVAFSNGTAFGAPQKWSDWMCIGQEICAVGNVNGLDPDYRRRDDAIAFARPGVWVALAGRTGFSPAENWSWMCAGQEVCAVGDFNRDGRDDVIAFVRDTQSGTGRGDVWVALSMPDPPDPPDPPEPVE